MMKELLIAVLLVLALPIGSLFNSYLLTDRCDRLMDLLEIEQASEEHIHAVSDAWKSLKRFAAYSTPYDLIRGANNACEGYLCRLSEDEGALETEASRVQFKSALGDLRRIHAFSLELIF